jgi:hypothetical protein
MPLIIDKILRAVIGLLFFLHFSESLETIKYNEIIFDSFILGLVSVVSLLSYRAFVFLNNIPSKKDGYFIVSIYIIGSIVLFLLNNQWWFTLFLLPLSKGSYYLEKIEPKSFYLINYIWLIISGCLAFINPFLFFLLIIPNIASGLFLFIRLFLNKSKVLQNFSRSSLIGFSIPLLLNAVLISIYTKLDVFLIESLVESDNFKMNYFNSVKVVDYVIMLPIVFISYSFRYWGVNNLIKSYYYDYRFIIIVSLLITLLAFFSAQIINMFFTIDIYAFQLYSLALPFVVINTIRNTVHLLTNKNWRVTLFSIVSVVLNLGLSLIFYNSIGDYSFLYGTIITQFTLFLFSIDIIKKNSILIQKKENIKHEFEL